MKQKIKKLKIIDPIHYAKISVAKEMGLIYNFKTRWFKKTSPSTPNQ